MSQDAWDIPVCCEDCGHYVDRDEIDPETGLCMECAESSKEEAAIEEAAWYEKLNRGYNRDRI